MGRIGDADDGRPPAGTFRIDDVYLPVSRRPVRRMPALVAGSFRLVWQAAPREFAISAALQVVAGIGIAAQLLVGRRVLAEVLAAGDRGGFGDVVPSLVALSIVTALVAFANLARIEQQQLLTELTSRHALDRVISVATSVDLLSYDDPRFHDRLQRAQVNAHVRPLQMASGVLGLLSAGLALLGIGTALFVLQPIFLLLVVLAYVPAWLATRRASKVVYDYAVGETERDRRRTYIAQVLVTKEHAKEVRTFGLAPVLRRRYADLYDERIGNLRRVVSRRLRLGLLGALATSVLTAGTLATLVWMVTTDRMPLASAGAAAGAVVLLGQRLQALAGSAGSLYESSLFLEDFTTFVDWVPPARPDGPASQAPPGFGTLAMSRVSFTYPSSETPSLRSISLEIGQGELVALVGENGSGKTTLAKLLAGLLTPTTGRITWDGVDVTRYDPASVREQVAVLFQDFVQYQLSLAENIGLGRPERLDDRAAVVDAARRAGVDGFVRRLPEGYESLLGPQFLGGTDLSVGQWQRLALGRAFFRDAPFLILDEPTASLDPRAEAELFEHVRALWGGRTVLLVSHRFSSVRNADRIFVLRKGRIIERGTHAELLQAGGHYAELFTMQAAAYLDPTP